MSPEPSEPVDLLIIGGGINGTGIARDAVGRGLSVLLAEKGDLASATSSASTKLIHGGLRYLEYYEFRLVRESLAEREVLLGLAPHIIWPLRFVMPHDKSLRPQWMIRAGLFLYDHIGGKRSLPASRRLDLTQHRAGLPLAETYRSGFEYADCWVDDARLVALNAVGAAARGATILTRTTCIGARRDADLWRVTLRTEDGASREVAARFLVNAAGPWVRDVLTGTLGQNASNAVRLVKGSHIVVPRLYEGQHAYIFQNDDRRIVFAIPYEHDFTLIGTTDLAADSPDQAAITSDEIAYLCRAVSRYFRRPVLPTEIVWSYSGIRPLYDDGHSDPSAITRDYVLDLDEKPDAAPILSVYGGKITTFRRLAEHALEKIVPHFQRQRRHIAPPWTHATALPGGELDGMNFDDYAKALAARLPAIEPPILRRLARRHGSRVVALLGDGARSGDLGPNFGGGLYGREIDWLMREEWANEPVDVLWRRTKCGLHMDQAGRHRVGEWMARQQTATAS